MPSPALALQIHGRNCPEGFSCLRQTLQANSELVSHKDKTAAFMYTPCNRRPTDYPKARRNRFLAAK